MNGIYIAKECIAILASDFPNYSIKINGQILYYNSSNQVCARMESIHEKYFRFKDQSIVEEVFCHLVNQFFQVNYY